MSEIETTNDSETLEKSKRLSEGLTRAKMRLELNQALMNLKSILGEIDKSFQKETIIIILLLVIITLGIITIFMI